MFSDFHIQCLKKLFPLLFSCAFVLFHLYTPDTFLFVLPCSFYPNIRKNPALQIWISKNRYEKSGWWESNPRIQLGRLVFYHWTTPALLVLLYLFFYFCQPINLIFFISALSKSTSFCYTYTIIGMLELRDMFSFAIIFRLGKLCTLMSNTMIYHY